MSEMKRTYCIRTKGDERAVDYYWAGSGWWTRRRDQAMTFNTPEAANVEMTKAVTVDLYDVKESADAAMAEA